MRVETRFGIGMWSLAAGVVLGVCAMAATGWSATLTWNAPGGVWSDGGNWSPAQQPVDGDLVIFGTTGSGGINTNDIASLSLNSYRATEGVHTNDLGGNTLTTAVFAVEGFNTGVTGRLAIVNGPSLVVTGNLSLAVGAYADAELVLDPGVGLTVGAENARVILRVGENTGASPSYGNGMLTSGENVNMWLSNLYVGRRNSGYSVGRTYGLLDLSAGTNAGVLDVSGNVYIGNDRLSAGNVVIPDSIDVRIGSESSRGGSLRIGQGGKASSAPLNPASSLVLGTGRLDAYVNGLQVGYGTYALGVLNASTAQGGILDISGDTYIGHVSDAGGGTVTLSDGIAVKIGDMGGRVFWGIGGGNPSSSSVTAGTNRFEAYVTTLQVAPSGGNSANALADVNLGSVVAGVLDVSGDVTLGNGRGARGTLILSDGFVTKIGDPGSPVTLLMSDGDRWRDFRFQAGGSFSGYFTTMLVGRRSLTTASYLAQTVLDLGAVTGGGAVGDGWNDYWLWTECPWI